MEQKALVKQAWLEAKLYESDDPRLIAFLRHFERAKLDCWAQLLQEVREHYPECKERLLVPIWESGDSTHAALSRRAPIAPSVSCSTNPALM